MSLFDDAVRLAECLCENLMDPARGDKVFAGTCCVVPGSSVPWDNCCEAGGQAWVAVLSGQPDGSQVNGGFSCASGAFDVTYELGVLRCVGAGLDCSCDCKEKGAEALLSDLEAVLKTAACCFQSHPDEFCEKPTVLSWSTVGPQGGCAGVKVLLQVPSTIDSCC